MSLLDRRKEIEAQKNKEKENLKLAVRSRIANSIKGAFSNEGLNLFVEEKLVELGVVFIGGFGCLCQSGYCSNSAGFPKLLVDFEQGWKDKGVSVSYGISGVCFILDGANYSSSSPEFHDFNTVLEYYQ